MERGMIAVDEWNCKSEAYFLTHLHADHTRGFSSKWCRGPLYCSSVTALLLPLKFPRFDKSFIRVLEVGSPSLIPLKSPKSGAQILLEVTPIGAHHCPGAVMYLFRGEFGCELYTGDFRWEVEGSNLGSGKEQLVGALGGAKVDHLHLDNTFCNPRFKFPPRHVAAQQVVDIISLYPEHDIVIGVDTLGKEELLLHIANVLKTKIWVWPERLQTMHLLGLPDVFTIDTSITRVRAVPRYSFSVQTVEVLNLTHPTIGILPTGSSWLFESSIIEDSSCGNFQQVTAPGQTEESVDGCLGGQTDDTNTRQLREYNLASVETFSKLVCGKIYLVPYSLHCCFSEIQSFIELIKPSYLIGNLSSSICEINPNYYFSQFCKGKQSCKLAEVYDNTESTSDRGSRQVWTISPGCCTLSKVGCKHKKRSLNIRRIRKRRLRKYLTVYTNKVNRVRRKGCGTKLSLD
eukprot:Gb_11424 [translate_table: standard]